jgi:hypothetical protein
MALRELIKAQRSHQPAIRQCMINKPSDFEIIKINQETRVLLLEDPNMGLQVEVPLKQTKLLSAKLISPYEVEVRYADGSAMAIRFLI